MSLALALIIAARSRLFPAFDATCRRPYSSPGNRYPTEGLFKRSKIRGTGDGRGNFPGNGKILPSTQKQLKIAVTQYIRGIRGDRGFPSGYK